MAVDGVLTDREPLGDGLIAEPARDQPQDFQFARGQALRIASCRAGSIGLCGRRQSIAKGFGGGRFDSRVEPDERVECAADFRDGRLPSIQSLERTCELDACACDLIRRVALQEPIDRVLEVPARLICTVCREG